jgi:hypothetical protein
MDLSTSSKCEVFNPQVTSYILYCLMYAESVLIHPNNW